MFIAVLDANGSDLLFSTYLGGSKEEVGTDIALDKDGHIYVTGTTWSPDFPATHNAWDTSFDDLVCDAFAARLLPRQTKKKTMFR